MDGSAQPEQTDADVRAWGRVWKWLAPVRRDKTLGPAAGRAFCEYLAHHTGYRPGRLVVYCRHLAAEFNCDGRAAVRWIHKLEEGGWIHIFEWDTRPGKARVDLYVYDPNSTVRKLSRPVDRQARFDWPEEDDDELPVVLSLDTRASDRPSGRSAVPGTRHPTTEDAAQGSQDAASSPSSLDTRASDRPSGRSAVPGTRYPTTEDAGQGSQDAASSPLETRGDRNSLVPTLAPDLVPTLARGKPRENKAQNAPRRENVTVWHQTVTTSPRILEDYAQHNPIPLDSTVPRIPRDSREEVGSSREVGDSEQDRVRALAAFFEAHDDPHDRRQVKQQMVRYISQGVGSPTMHASIPGRAADLVIELGFPFELLEEIVETIRAKRIAGELRKDPRCIFLACVKTACLKAGLVWPERKRRPE